MSGLVGTAAEGFDYCIFGSAAEPVFPRLFLPIADLTTDVILSSRPVVGAVLGPLDRRLVFGHFGDRMDEGTS